MADFSIPFARDAERRYPTQTESELGFPCGAADRRLFNGLQHRLEAEIGHVIDFAGIPPTDTKHTLLREAIEALINAATGGGDPSQYLLITQARARLPIYPEILNVDGRIVVTSPAAGTVRLPGGVDFLHRGIFPVTTAQQDFLTDPSKTYHMRWNPTDGFTLKDLASVVYNPSSLVETNATFDSKYDDMLVARIITNSSNVPSITNLANKHQLFANVLMVGTDWINPGTNTASGSFSATYDWARTPKHRSYNKASLDYADNAGHDEDFRIQTYGGASAISQYPADRYRSRFNLLMDFVSGGNLDAFFMA